MTMRKPYSIGIALGVAGVASFGLLGAPISVGAASQSFANNLYFGLTNNADVTNLQQFLTNEGAYSGPITGNFFSLTLKGVKDFQTKNNISPVSGYFGPLTRAKANDVLALELQTYQSQFGAFQIGPVTSSTTTTPPTGIQTPTSLNSVTLLQARIGGLFQQLWSLQNKHKTPTPTPTPTSTPPSGGGGGGGRGGGGSGTSPSPATTTLTINLVVNGGTAAASDFNVTAIDNTASLTLFSGAGSSTPLSFTLTQGDAYLVSEATTSNSANYTISMSTACSGTAGTASTNCTITDTYVPPPPPAPAPALAIIPSTIPNGTASVAYGPAVLTASTTANGPFAWSVNSGSLPNGLSLNTSSVSVTTTIAGMPGTAGTSTFSIKATNGASSSTRSYTIGIAAAPVTPPAPTPTSTLTVTISVNGGSATAANFNLTVKDAATTVFSGAAAASKNFAITQGDAYSVAEATTTNSASYTIALGNACAGTMGASAVTCAITNTFVQSTPTSTPTSTTPTSTGSPYPWHTNITATVFWIGEGSIPGYTEVNTISTYDGSWEADYGGVDDTALRTYPFFPTSFYPKENPFYLDVPFDDINNPTAYAWRVNIPWYTGNTSQNYSYMKNVWVKLTKGSNVCYGQNEDAGPFDYADYNYVFGTNDQRPLNKQANSAGMDVSPALRDCLGFNGLDNAENQVNWQFVPASNVPSGPWTTVITTSQVNW